jgi:hypothetical protein
VDEDWYPQGISAACDLEGVDPGLVITSWARDGHRASRLTFADPAAGRYRHVELVEGQDLRPVAVHAGGIACHRRRVYVADTFRGLRVFSLDRLHADGDRFVLVQAGAYRLPLWRTLLGRGVRFSFVSRSAGGAPPVLVSGEYFRERPSRLVEWRLPAAEGEALEATARHTTARTHLQGVLRIGERLLLASSAGTGRPGKLAVCERAGSAEPVAVHPWAVGCEDLAYDSARGLVLSLTEHPHHPAERPRAGRVVFGVRLPD